jgi:hypothetical protein
LALFLERHPEAKENLEVILLGKSLAPEYKSRIEGLDLQNIIREQEAVGRHDLVELMWMADLFLLIQPVHNTTSISGTMYEYWAVGKSPVLLISEKGANSSLLEHYHLGKHFHFSEIEPCADYLEALYLKYKRGYPEWISREGIENFDRKKLAEKMQEIWVNVLSTT